MCRGMQKSQQAARYALKSEVITAFSLKCCIQVISTLMQGFWHMQVYHGTINGCRRILGRRAPQES